MELEPTVWASSIVMLRVIGPDNAQVALAEDQHRSIPSVRTLSMNRSAYELDPVAWTPRVGGSATASNSTVVSIPIPECRRVVLYQYSIHPKIALASSVCVSGS